MRLLAICFFTILLASCSKEKSVYNYEENSEIIKVDISESEEILASDFFSDIKYTEIQTPSNEPIGRVSKIIANKNVIGLFDDAKGSVWLFNPEGVYINEVTIPEGRGPGELIHLQDIIITNDQKIHALGTHKIVVYDFKGQITDEIEFQFLIYKFTYLEDSATYIGYADNVPNYGMNNSFEGHNLLQFNKNGRIVNSYLPINKGRENLGFDIPSRFTVYGNNQIFFAQLDDNIYQINNSSVIPKYVLDFGAYSVPENAYITRDRYGLSGGAEFIEKELLEKNYVVFKSFFFETDAYLFFQFSTGFEPYTVFHNKKAEKTQVTSGTFINDINFGPDVWQYSSFENTAYSIIESHSFLTHLNNVYENDKDKYNDPRMQPIIDLAHALDENSNPVLQIATFYAKGEK